MRRQINTDAHHCAVPTAEGWLMSNCWGHGLRPVTGEQAREWLREAVEDLGEEGLGSDCCAHLLHRMVQEDNAELLGEEKIP